ncbi:hypothetical protein [Natronosalvus rutilus]|uniref:Uncharacterized protein n=1 Tax=Natronosalvus rutilus TaxID=2953753 RepID=A0A9E7N8C0_9EURY|nr:hypothetical protein [Natronosalvus rutilus]UTF52731.1 hypothetical protein NGM29_13190 [Natronosalvus rutilus]
MGDSPNDADDEMHHSVDWMRPSDRPIVKKIVEYGGDWVKAPTLALNLPYTRRHISNRCRELADHGLLEKHPDKAAYRPIEQSYKFLRDELNADELEDEED